MNAYEAKIAARKARLEDRAERLAAKGNAAIERADKMASIIPFGQPILVGHHSERGDRNYRARIRSTFQRGYETLNAAKETAARADSVGTSGISSDDPDAILKLRAKLAECEEAQAKMTAANKLVRKGDRDGLAGLGYSPRTIDLLLKGDDIGRKGFADFQLSNNGAEIRRLRLRIEGLERNTARETKETERQDGLRIVENAEANRLQILFPDKPSADARAILKASGFRWAPSEGAWQRQLNNGARWAAEDALRRIDALTKV